MLSITLFLRCPNPQGPDGQEAFGCFELGNFLPPSLSLTHTHTETHFKKLPHLHNAKQKDHKLNDLEILLMKKTRVSDTSQGPPGNSCFAL